MEISFTGETLALRERSFLSETTREADAAAAHPPHYLLYIHTAAQRAPVLRLSAKRNENSFLRSVADGKTSGLSTSSPRTDLSYDSQKNIGKNRKTVLATRERVREEKDLGRESVIDTGLSPARLQPLALAIPPFRGKNCSFPSTALHRKKPALPYADSMMFHPERTAEEKRRSQPREKTGKTTMREITRKPDKTRTCPFNLPQLFHSGKKTASRPRKEDAFPEWTLPYGPRETGEKNTCRAVVLQE